MPKDDLIRLQHMLDAAKEALSFAKNKTRASLYDDRMLALSIVKSIEIIGEVPVVTQGKTIDKVVANLREAVALHLEGEDLEQIGLAPNPTLIITMETEPLESVA